MGICGTSSNKDIKTKQIIQINQSSIIKEKNNNENQSEIKEEEDERFKDMPEWGNNIMKGFGIKQMPAYKCDLKIDELIELRDQFWASRQTHKIQWKNIHQACVYDHIKAEEYLYKNNIKTLDGCINQCVDAYGNIYKVPNFCINDPYFELELLPKDNSHNEEIEITLFDIINQKNIKLKVNESEKGCDIIKKYAEKNNIDLNDNVIRLLFGGGIIKDDDTLYQHKVKNGFSIQICVSKKN
jgi:hypothetical protein